MQKVAVLALCAAMFCLGVPTHAHAADFALGAVLPDGVQAGVCAVLLVLGFVLLHRAARRK